MGRPGYACDLVCKPAEDVVEDAEFWCVADGLVFLHEAHANLLDGIARWGIDVAGVGLCEQLEDIEDLCEGEVWGV